MEVRKERGGAAPCRVSEDEMKAINRLSKSELSADEVYTFAVRLCDNEVDRDGERFAAQTLEQLGELFVGKSGIFDHEWTTEGQTARIYRTEVCCEENVRTAAGDAYRYLKGYAYMLRSEKNKDLIAEIEAGIKKEVSVGCSVKRSVCSVCGKEIDACAHVRGERYGGKLCYAELQEAADAYEWSFVAVPAQKKAGVMKRYGVKSGALTLKSLVEQHGGEVLAKELRNLEKDAETGRRYMAALRNETVRLAMLNEDTEESVLRSVAEKMSEAELTEMKRVQEKRLGEWLGMPCQLPQQSRRTAKKPSDEFLV